MRSLISLHWEQGCIEYGHFSRLAELILTGPILMGSTKHLLGRFSLKFGCVFWDRKKKSNNFGHILTLVLGQFRKILKIGPGSLLLQFLIK